MARARIVPIAFLFVLSGCVLETLTGVDPPELDFSAESAGHGQWLEEPEIDASEIVGGIEVSGRLSTPDPCQRLTGELDRSGARVDLRVTITREGEACVAMIGTFRYTAVVSGLVPGTYLLRIIHDYPGTGWPSGVVLERNVIVR